MVPRETDASQNATMDPLLISAASGMNARMESLDMLANNIANSGTVGFKTDKEFYSLYEQQLPMIQQQWIDFSQGMLTPTGSALDLALAGQGFFALNGPQGTIYTRGGQFQVSKSNQLQNADGYTLRDTKNNGLPSTVDPTQPIEIDKDGTVQQNGQVLAQIEISGVENPAQALSKMGGSYFISSPQSAKPILLPDTEVRQGALEQSNVPVADSAVRLVSIMRQFEMLQKAMTVGADMDKQAVEEVARVS
jgi:flagellar basal-body rod protein FlgF